MCKVEKAPFCVDVIVIIRDHGIDLMMIEFTGQKEVLSFLNARGYIMFDTRYMLIPHSGAALVQGWIIEGSTYLSTGIKAYFGWPTDRPTELMNHCEMLRKVRQEIGYVQTDIVAVHRSFLAKFLNALSRYSAIPNVT